METIKPNNPFFLEFFGAFGLKHVKKFALHLDINSLPRVEVEFYPEIDELRRLPSIIKKYSMVVDETSTGVEMAYEDQISPERRQSGDY